MDHRLTSLQMTVKEYLRDSCSSLCCINNGRRGCWSALMTLLLYNCTNTVFGFSSNQDYTKAMSLAFAFPDLLLTAAEFWLARSLVWWSQIWQGGRWKGRKQARFFFWWENRVRNTIEINICCATGNSTLYQIDFPDGTELVRWWWAVHIQKFGIDSIVGIWIFMTITVYA